MPLRDLPRRHPRAVAVAGAVLAGLCLAASVPPWGWWPLAFVGVALWDRLLAGRGAWSRFGRSWVLGVAWLGPAMLWMEDMTLPGYPVAVGVFAAYIGVAGAMVPGRSTRPWARWIALPGALVLAEAARWTFPFGGVPLATTAMSQAAAPLGQVARVVCAIGVVLTVGVVGVALSALWERRWTIGAVVLAGVVALWAFSLVAPDGHAVGDLRVAVVQGGGKQNTRAADTDPKEVFARQVAATEQITSPVDLVVWPENVVDIEKPLAETSDGAELGVLARQLDATLVVGVTEGLGPSHFVNAATVIAPSGSIGDSYEKVRRVPFGEYVPFRGLVETLAGKNSGLPPRDAIVGHDPAVVHTEVGTLAVAISWEIFFTNRVRAGVTHGGEVVLNPTNGSSYWLTQVQSQQVASSRLRAIESGRWVLQAAPTGFSAIVTPEGRVVDRTGVSEQRVLIDTVERRTGQTIAMTMGPEPIVVLALVLVAAGWWFAHGTELRRRRRESHVAEHALHDALEGHPPPAGPGGDDGPLSPDPPEGRGPPAPG